MIRIALVFFGAGILIGCSPSASSTSASSGNSFTGAQQPGLVVEQWRFSAEEGQLDAAVSGIIPDDSEPIYGEDGFRRDGFRVVVLNTEDVMKLWTEIDSTSPIRTIRHGEAISWRDVLSRSIDKNTVVLENGRARRLPQSVLGLAARGWSVPTIEGAGVHLQMVPHLNLQRMSNAGRKRQGELRGQPLSKAIETTLQEGTVLLVSSAPVLRASDEDSDSEPSSFFPSTGPNAPLPPTVAELLLDDDNGRIRSVLVIRGTPNSAYTPQPRTTP